jgi:purine-binding chemotaxis protein CheW
MSSPRQFCTFLLAGHWFGLPVNRVQEVLRYQVLTPVPLAPDCVAGLINLRGQIVTVIDLRRRLQLAARPAPTSGTNIITRTGDELISLLVDEMGNVQDVAAEQFDPLPDTVRGMPRELIQGTYKLPERLLLILDVAQVVPSVMQSIPNTAT